MALTPGSRLGAYEVTALIGSGGMGEVYRAHDTKLDRDVALKVLREEDLQDDRSRGRLLREARSAAALNHPHICTIHEVGEAEGHAYIAMEFIDGQSLDRLIPTGGFPIAQVLRYGLQMTDAVAHAHGRGVVHRDLKSANVVITSEGRAKVLDFGLAKRVSGDELAEATTQSLVSVSQPGALVGTLPYMAPEQLRGEPADARSDIWALGVVLYEMSAGGRPFRGRTGFEVSAAILSQPPPPLSSDVPPELPAVIERCLEKDPAARYQRAADVRSALEAIQTGTAAPSAARRSRAQRRVAVLPLNNVSGDPEQEYFVDGTHEALITDLAQLSALRVIARSSVMRYKETDKALHEIAEELKVDAVLTGSVMRAGDRVRITAQLLDAASEEHLWAGRYEREFRDVLSLQSEIVTAIAGGIRLQLTPQEQARLAAAPAVNPEAYEAYLRGRFHWYKFTPEDFETALQYFELALEKDPKYALAHAGVVGVWTARQQMGLVPASEAGPRARAAAMKALALDNTLAEVHYNLAVVSTWIEWDWEGAETAFRRAIALNPNHPDVRAYYSHFLNIMRRPEEAMAQIERALQLDPFNPLCRALYAMDLNFVHRYDDAVAALRDLLRTAPNDPIPRSAFRSALHHKGMYEEAFEEWKASYAARGDREAEDALARGYLEGGYRGAMLRVAETLIGRSRTTYVTPWRIATLYVRAGKHDEALQWFEKAYEVHDPNMPYLSVDPLFDNLRDDSRFQNLLGRMNLPQ